MATDAATERSGTRRRDRRSRSRPWLRARGPPPRCRSPHHWYVSSSRRGWGCGEARVRQQPRQRLTHQRLDSPSAPTGPVLADAAQGQVAPASLDLLHRRAEEAQPEAEVRIRDTVAAVLRRPRGHGKLRGDHPLVGEDPQRPLERRRPDPAGGTGDVGERPLSAPDRGRTRSQARWSMPSKAPSESIRYGTSSMTTMLGRSCGSAAARKL